ncbi:MAG: HAD-IIA family hydrolase [Candidatus Micrarchaeota archaeon]
MKFKGVVLDVDGVLILGGTAIPGAGEAVKKLREGGLGIRVITNNSTRSRRTLCKRLNELGIDVNEDEVITSSSGTANYLKERFGAGKVFIIGEQGIADELVAVGFELTLEDDADFVVVGLDRQFNYDKLATALNAIRKGARFIATNDDATLPVERGAEPGAGAMVAALIWCSQKKPEAVVGKPNSFLFEQALKELGTKAEETLVVGDRLETDIVGGNDLGMVTVLVLTGASTEEEWKRAEKGYNPRLLLKSIADLPEKVV